MIEHFDDDGLLAFDAEGVDRVRKIDAEALGEDADGGQNLVEVGFDSNGSGTVVEGLGELAEGDVSMRINDERFEAGGGGVGGHGGRGVRLGWRRRHAVVFEAAGGVVALVLEGDGVEAGVGGGFGTGEEGVLPSRKVTTCSKPSKRSSLSR